MHETHGESFILCLPKSNIMYKYDCILHSTQQKERPKTLVSLSNLSTTIYVPV